MFVIVKEKKMKQKKNPPPKQNKTLNIFRILRK